MPLEKLTGAIIGRGQSGQTMGQITGRASSLRLTHVPGKFKVCQLPGSLPVPACAGTKAESAARERGRPVEPAPGNAGEGILSSPALWRFTSGKAK